MSGGDGPRFYALPANVAAREDLTPSAKLVLMALAFHAWGDKIEVWPGVAKIARAIGIRSRTTVQTALKELQEAGLVTMEERYDRQKNGAQTSNLYRLDPCTKIVHPPAQDLSTPSTEVVHPPPKDCAPPCPDVGHEVTKTLNEQKGTKRRELSPDGYTVDFESFWGLYPRRIGKKAGWGKWNAQIKKGASPEDLITAAKHYASACQGREERFMKLPATFLGPDDHWRDHLEAPRLDRPPHGPGDAGQSKAAQSLANWIEEDA